MIKQQQQQQQLQLNQPNLLAETNGWSQWNTTFSVCGHVLHLYRIVYVGKYQFQLLSGVLGDLN